MFFTLVVTVVLWPLLITAEVNAPYIDEPSCSEAIQCCRHQPQSQEFQDCCNHFGCCPQCQGGCIDIVSNEWLRRPVDHFKIYECCVYPFDSEEWHDCCHIHSCCPICHGFSKGCCYNGLRYWWGSVVESLPECCTDLVCGVQVSNSTTFFTAVVLPLQSPPSSPDQYCGEPQNDYCIEASGVIRCDGCEWSKSQCRRCLCDNGVITCHTVTPECPPAPYTYCRLVPGHCCPTWDCTLDESCIDVDGNVHSVGDSWWDPRDPCVYITCTESGLKEAVRDCAPPGPPPHQNCQLERGEAECCPTWMCRGCVDEEGQQRQVGESWQDLRDSCTNHICTDSGITTSTAMDHCSPFPPPPHQDCRLVQENCCTVWKCPGCVDNHGIHHQLGETWTDPNDPCQRWLCSGRGIEERPIHCPDLDPPLHSDCIRTVQDCCPVWHCPGCVDVWGHYQGLGDGSPDPADPCVTLTCTTDGIQSSHLPCPPLSPPPQSVCILRKENCCNTWQCPECVDGSGKMREVGEVWQHPTNQCLVLECTTNGIRERWMTCPTAPPWPGPECVFVVVDGCCPTWQCPGCVDQGNLRDLGETWADPTDPCMVWVCTQDGPIEILNRQCPQLVQPLHDDCRLAVIDCCPSWNCSGCGEVREVGEVWQHPTNQCLVLECTTDGIRERWKTCPTALPRPGPKCVFVVVDGCCPTWQCPSCVDDQGNPHDLGETWADPIDPCLVRVCTVDGLRQIPKGDCPPLPHLPHDHCIAMEVDCCPAWNCTKVCPEVDPNIRCIHFFNECFKDEDCLEGSICCPGACGLICSLGGIHNRNCTDTNGQERMIGETWPHPTDPCVSLTCQSQGILENRIFCDFIPAPSPLCREIQQEDECCPYWDCPLRCPSLNKTDTRCQFVHHIECQKDFDCPERYNCCPGPCGNECINVCVGEDGSVHRVGEQWEVPSDPCTTFICWPDGIRKATKMCLPPRQPHASCRLVWDGQCCWVWNCLK